MFKNTFNKTYPGIFSTSDKTDFNKTVNMKFINKLFMNLAIMLLLISPISFAQISAEKSHSVGEVKSNLTAQEKKHKVTNAISRNQLKTLAYKGMSREDVSVARQQEFNAVSSKNALNPLLQNSVQPSIARNSAFYYSFSIYNGYSQLIEDIDEDGYFQTFSVTFDADILSPTMNDQGVVYADLYLSENGGPWILYFSTDDFVITGDSSADEFEVITQLDSGYTPNHYDVLIDLYEAGYSDVVATYSSNDTNALYGLPLESSDFDPEYIEVESYSEHGGGSVIMFTFILVAFFYRRVLVK